MKHLKSTRIASALALACTLSVAGAEAADTDNHQAKLNKRLHGEYSAIGHEFCAGAGSGFGAAPNFQALSPVVNTAVTNQAVQKFDGKGNFSSTAHAEATNTTAANDSSPAFPVTETALTCTGTYEVHDDDTFDLVASCNGTQVAGRFAGTLQSIGSPVQSSGRILGKTIQFAHVTAAVSTTVIKIGPTFQTTTSSVCHGETTAHKILPRDTEPTEVNAAE